jgi:hypothetical protein
MPHMANTWAVLDAQVELVTSWAVGVVEEGGNRKQLVKKGSDWVSKSVCVLAYAKMNYYNENRSMLSGSVFVLRIVQKRDWNST